MFGNLFISSRKEKERILSRIIQELRISDSEKEIYLLSMEILENTDFDIFYEKITGNLNLNSEEKRSIEPLSTTLI
jgi:hypothetical protein